MAVGEVCGGGDAGLAAVGVALVASAAGGLARNTCKDRVTQAIATLAAVTIVMYQATWVFPLVIVLGEPQPCAHTGRLGCASLLAERLFFLWRDCAVHVPGVDVLNAGSVCGIPIARHHLSRCRRVDRDETPGGGRRWARDFDAQAVGGAASGAGRVFRRVESGRFTLHRAGVGRAVAHDSDRRHCGSPLSYLAGVRHGHHSCLLRKLLWYGRMSIALVRQAWMPSNSCPFHRHEGMGKSHHLLRV